MHGDEVNFIKESLQSFIFKILKKLGTQVFLFVGHGTLILFLMQNLSVPKIPLSLVLK